MGNESASGWRTCLHSHRTHVPIISIVAVWMMQTDVNSKIDAVILRVPPSGINNLIRICGGIDRTIGNTIVHTIMTIIEYECTQAVRPIPSTASITNARLWRRRTGRRRRWTVFACLIACECKHAVIECIVRRGMIEDGLFRSQARIWRIKKGCNCLRLRRIHIVSRCARRA